MLVLQSVREGGRSSTTQKEAQSFRMRQVHQSSVLRRELHIARREDASHQMAPVVWPDELGKGNIFSHWIVCRFTDKLACIHWSSLTRSNALVDNPSAEVIIGKMMIRPEGIAGIFPDRIHDCFEMTLDSLEEDDSGPTSCYAITVNNGRQSTLVTQYVASRLLLWEVSRVLTGTRDVLGAGNIGSCTEETVSK